MPETLPLFPVPEPPDDGAGPETPMERLDRELMDKVKNDVAAERARKELELALESRKITTKISKQRKASEAS